MLRCRLCGLDAGELKGLQGTCPQTNDRSMGVDAWTALLRRW